jgi:glycosyltransferase involved in cell wall biosynthesis
MNINAKVSVSLMTFNHENYIKECLDSILNQKTDFEVEIVIGDDASTDSTQSILQSYSKKHKNIKLIARELNIGLHDNFLDIIENCTGKYVALLEGDDYWLDFNKLQKQYDVLEAHPEVSFCFGNCVTFNDGDFVDGRLSYKEDFKILEPFNFKFYMDNAISIPNNTKMFRKSSIPKPMPTIFHQVIQWDWLLHVFMLQGSKAIYVNDVFLAYRRHSNTVINPKNNIRIFKDAIYTVENINAYIQDKYHHYFKQPLFELNSLAFEYLKQKKFLLFFKIYSKWFCQVTFKKIIGLPI